MKSQMDMLNVCMYIHSGMSQDCSVSIDHTHQKDTFEYEHSIVAFSQKAM